MLSGNIHRPTVVARRAIKILENWSLAGPVLVTGVCSCGDCNNSAGMKCPNEAMYVPMCCVICVYSIIIKHFCQVSFRYGFFYTHDVKKPKVIVICGPTATGKSSLAVRLAKKVSGEIISADSRQVYKGIDLLSGKMTAKEMGNVPHYALDVISPKKIFSVSDFQLLTKKTIIGIVNRGNMPIVVGGTGFYIDTVLYDTTFPTVPANNKLRTKLSKNTPTENMAILRALDHNRANTIDQHNNVRIIRAIEIAGTLGSVPKLTARKSLYTTLTIGLDLPDNALRKLIHLRLIERVENGMLEEALRLHAQGVSWKRMGSLGLECRLSALYLQKKISKIDFFEKLETEIWQYAKRQRTWFKRNKNIHWFDPSKKTHLKEINQLVKDFLAQ